MEARKKRRLVIAAATLAIAVVCAVVFLLLSDRGSVGDAVHPRSKTASPPESTGSRFGPRTPVESDTRGEDAVAELPRPTVAVDESGSPLGGVGTTTETGEPSGSQRHLIWVMADGGTHVEVVHPNSTGEFHVRQFAPDALVSLVAFDSDDRDAMLVADGPIAVNRLPGLTIAFRESPPIEVQVRCEDSGDRPVAASFRIDRVSADRRRTVARVKTGPEGLATLSLPGPGKYHAVLTESRARSNPTYWPLEFPFEIGTSSPVTVPVTIPAPADLRVRVVTQDGVALRGASLNLLFDDGGITREHHMTGAVDEDGAREFPGLVAGEYFVQAYSAGRLPSVRRVNLTAGRSETVEIQLIEGGAELRGTVLLDDEPLGLTKRDGYLLLRGRRAEEMFAFWSIDFPGDGRFRAHGLPHGQYELSLYGAANGVVVRCFVSTDQTDMGEIDITPAAARDGDASVQIRLLVDAPPTMRLKLLYRNESWPSPLWRSHALTGSGEYSPIDGLTSGTYRFELSPAALDVVTFDISQAVVVRYVGENDGEPTLIDLGLPRRE